MGLPRGQVAAGTPGGVGCGARQGEEAAGGPGQVPRGGGERGRALGGWDTGRVRSWRFPVPDLFNFPSHSCPGSGGSGGSGSGSSPAALTAEAQTAEGSGSAEPRAPRPASGRSPAKTNGPSLFIAAAGPQRLRAGRRQLSAQGSGAHPPRAAAAPRRRHRHRPRPRHRPQHRHRHRHLPAGCAPHGEPRAGRRERRPSLVGSAEPPVPRAAPGPPGAP